MAPQGRLGPSGPALSPAGPPWALQGRPRPCEVAPGPAGRPWARQGGPGPCKRPGRRRAALGPAGPPKAPQGPPWHRKPALGPARALLAPPDNRGGQDNAHADQGNPGLTPGPVSAFKLCQQIRSVVSTDQAKPKVRQTPEIRPLGHCFNAENRCFNRSEPLFQRNMGNVNEARQDWGGPCHAHTRHAETTLMCRGHKP